jgi:hypothetical protein
MFSATATSTQAINAGQKVRRIDITRTLKLPVVKMLQINGAEDGSAQRSPALAIWPGATDEPPEGPSGFDVFDDGNVVITDPLLQRLVLYDASGKFQRAWAIGFPADSVKVTSAGMMLVHQVNTGEIHVFDREGKLQTGSVSTEVMAPQARVTSGTSGMILGAGSDKRSLPVHYEEQGSSLLSLESVADDRDRGSFVALETSVPENNDAINVRKLVRRYSVTGVLLSESSPLPLDYYIQPVDEIRVRKGVIYQLMTTPTEVRINEWDTN